MTMLFDDTELDEYLFNRESRDWSQGEQLDEESEKAFRKTQEKAYKKSQIIWPKPSTCRAICYASLIYQWATHDVPIDYNNVEKMIAQKHRPWCAGNVDPKDVYVAKSRKYYNLEDTRPGLAIIPVVGRNWKLIYVVFRGSRGDKSTDTERKWGHVFKKGKSFKESINPKGAGWDETTGKNVDWRVDLDTRQVKFMNHSPKNDVLVHNGFHEMYQSLRAEILREVAGRDPEHSIIICTGHSLGASLATLCALDLSYLYPANTMFIAFCNPRSGNRGYVEEFSRQFVNRPLIELESDGVAAVRAVWFDQKNDPVTYSGKYGHKPKVYKGAQATKRRADSLFKGKDGSVAPLAYGSNIPEQGTVKKALNAMRTMDEDKSIKFYHVQNMIQISYTGMHGYTDMMNDIFECSFFNKIAKNKGMFVFTG